MKIKWIFCLLVALTFNVCIENVSAQNVNSSFSSFINGDFRPVVNKSEEENKNHYLKPVGLIVPGSLIIYPGLKPFINGIPKLDDNIMDDMKERYSSFHTTAENYIMWAPSASVYLLDAAKVKTSHSFKQHLLIEAASIVITGGIGYGMRIISSNIKVYKTDKTEFPSGHTANAFRGAEILHQEIKETHPVWSYSGYFVAAGVGVLRIYNQQHFLTEVVAGAGLGIISTKLTYWILNKLRIIN